MDIQVIEENSNPMLNRREVIFKVIHDEATPTRKSVVERLAATMNSKPGLVFVDSLRTEFGKRETIGYAKIYETAERAKQVERPHIVERNTFVKAEEKAEEAKPEAS
ncbi:30S ribosomal protein S24e [uncultured archaeon]|nr:30S ribosomal protein S24e [uncultured archaeon]